MKEIPLTQGKVALVDDKDHKALSQFKWFADRSRRTWYAKRKEPKPGGGQKTVPMHRLVLEWKLGRDIAHGMQCDHEDGNGLNNQRDNLFEVTHRRNGENRHEPRSSNFVGVSWYKRDKKWTAAIQVADKSIYLGSFETEFGAARARERYIEAHPELGARSNFPKGTT